MDTKNKKLRLLFLVSTAVVSLGFVSAQSFDGAQAVTEKTAHIEAGLGANLEAEILQLSRLTGLSIEEMLSDMLNNEQHLEVLQTK